MTITVDDSGLLLSRLLYVWRLLIAVNSLRVLILDLLLKLSLWIWNIRAHAYIQAGQFVLLVPVLLLLLLFVRLFVCLFLFLIWNRADGRRSEGKKIKNTQKVKQDAFKSDKTRQNANVRGNRLL